MQESGASCVASIASFKSLLAKLPRLPDELAVAKALIMMMKTSSESPMLSIWTSKISSTDAEKHAYGQAWQSDVYVSVLNELVRFHFYLAFLQAFFPNGKI
jgi:hypothetical protein